MDRLAVEQLTAVHLLAACQALDLGGRASSERSKAMLAAVREHVAPVTHDRPMDGDIAVVTMGSTEGTAMDAVEQPKYPTRAF